MMMLECDNCGYVMKGKFEDVMVLCPECGMGNMFERR